jgi:Cu2+-exporting ATPase
MKGTPHGIAYEVVHVTKGRIRLRISELETSSAYAARLEQLIALYASKAGSQIHTRINRAANSVIISYDPKIFPEPVIRQHLNAIIQQAGDVNMEVDRLPSLESTHAQW